ncbi:MAG: hypothetical protein M1838_005177 [Thelocarpon superellum]|nr:MAG: hypothetical protein M1838_005177 [Thelocarpon superellum]
MEEGSYAPESPDLTPYHDPTFRADPTVYQPQSSAYPTPYATAHYNLAPYPPPPPSEHAHYGTVPGNPQRYQPATESGSLTEAPGLRTRGRSGMAAPAVAAARPKADVEVKTKFPVARIKRIMQADEDVGKVAQVTPVAVSKALELFMIALVSSAAEEASAKSSKRITAVHLKRSVERSKQLDFLWDITSKIPDATDKTEDEPDAAEGKRKKAPTRKKRTESDEF